MPHAWRFAARSNASPSSCDKADADGGFLSVVSAFADRTPIDWTALFYRVRTDDRRRLLHALRTVETIRRAHSSAVVWEPPRIRTRALRWLVLLGVYQILRALATAAADPAAVAAAGLLPHLLLACSFGMAGAILAVAAGRDPRGVFLLAAFTFSACAFARALLTGLEPSAGGMLLRGVFPEAFVPAALWQFAVLFPSVRRFTRFDVFARQAATVAWTLAGALLVSNIFIAYGAGARVLSLVGREDERNLFWHLFVLASLPAVLSIPIRALRAPREEQVKVQRFAGAIAIGSMPFLALGLTRMLLPSFNHWLLTAHGLMRTGVDMVVIGGLAMMPLLSAIAVLADDALHAGRLSVAIRRLAGRWQLFPTVSSSERWIGPGKRRRRLRESLERVRLARTPREIHEVLRREMQFALRARFVRMVEPTALPGRSALRAILSEDPGPIALRRDAEPFALLPADDRRWLEAGRVGLIAALHGQADVIRSVVLAGFRPGQVLSAADLWFASMLITAVAAAWDAQATAANASTAFADTAFECRTCGRVRREPLPCCGGEPALAALPGILNDKFTVVRRLGAGGMGVVYLARDISLGRSVALKTLPSLRPGRMARLRREARTMAALNHPALATIYGLEIWRGTPVLVLEHFPLGTLSDRLARDELPIGEVLTLGVRLAGALAYMHAHDVLHRDIKPSNIGFTADGAAKMFDLGLALDVVAAGTPGFVSPEALAGHPPDAAMDLWALATVLRHACGPRAGSIDQLREFFARALALRPDQRFQSAADLGAALERIRA
jgi:hypothetical protein